MLEKPDLLLPVRAALEEALCIVLSISTESGFLVGDHCFLVFFSGMDVWKVTGEKDKQQ